MSASEDAFRDAAAFFTLFGASQWKSCHLSTGGLEIFVSRDGATANPMTGETGEVTSPHAASVDTLRAPHIGTLIALAELGRPIEAGQIYASLELLGETIALTAEKRGIVADHLMAIGALAEFDQALLTLR